MQPNASDARAVDREVLYHELWETPGTRLAKKYGVSDVALGKACQRHNIPRPPVGYWTMRRHGYEMDRPPLPPLDDPRLQQVRFSPSTRRLPITVIADAAAEPVEHTRTAIVVPDQLASPHPLVEAAKFPTRHMLGVLGVVDSDALFRITQKDIAAVEQQYTSARWSEVCRVLEGLGYDVSGRSFWL